MSSISSLSRLAKSAQATSWRTPVSGSRKASQTQDSLGVSTMDFGDEDEDDMVLTQPPSDEQPYNSSWKPGAGLMAVVSAATISDQSSAAFDSQAILPGRAKGRTWVSSQGTDDSTDTAFSNESLAYGSTPSHSRPDQVYYNNPLMSLADAAKQEIEATEKILAGSDDPAAVLTSLRNSHPRKSYDSVIVDPIISQPAVRQELAHVGHNDAMETSDLEGQHEDDDEGREGDEDADGEVEYDGPSGYPYAAPHYGYSSGYPYSGAYKPYYAGSAHPSGSVTYTPRPEAAELAPTSDAGEEEMRDWGGNEVRRPRRQAVIRRYVDDDDDEENDDLSSSAEDGRPAAPIDAGPTGSRADRRVAAAEKRKRAVAKIEASAEAKPKMRKKKKGGAASSSAGGGTASPLGGTGGKKVPRRHKCEECGKTFDRAFNLSQHLQATHRNIRNWICPVEACSREFSRKNDRNRHCRTVHRDIVIPAERLAVPS